ncbi:hypothetical protein IAT38_006141 [Cryptococcus sp. DSM 104549]
MPESSSLADIPDPFRVSSSSLFHPISLGSLHLKHRVALAPLTRNRGKPSSFLRDTWVPWGIHITYYTQRSSEGGLLISEALPVSQQARGKAMINAPGIFTSEQVEAWKTVVSAVKATGAVFVAQLFHGGRTAGHGIHPCVSSSAVRIDAALSGNPGDTPLEMTEDDISRVINDYVQAAKNAIIAGFDGVEIQKMTEAAEMDIFLHSNINHRTDKYGGSIENRNRFVLELCDAVAEAVGPSRFGLRLAPYGFFNETRGAERVEQWTALCKEIGTRGWAYVHVSAFSCCTSTSDGLDHLPTTNAMSVREKFIEARYDEILSAKTKLSRLLQPGASSTSMPTIAPFRAVLQGTPIISAGGYDTSNCLHTITSGQADVIGFGRYFTSNPDLVYRIKHNKELVKYIRPRFYAWPEGRPEEGYTDFSNCSDNLNSEEDRVLYEQHKARGWDIVESGWQLSQDGVQLGEIYDLRDK